MLVFICEECPTPCILTLDAPESLHPKKCPFDGGKCAWKVKASPMQRRR